LERNRLAQLVTKNKLIQQSSYRFLDPIINGWYPYSMQEIVKDRLPLFSDEESRMVKGSIDYVGINHYTSFYMKDPGTWNLTPVSYQDDWHVGFVCKFLTRLTKILNSAVYCAAVNCD
jgi:beta-glucosidase/6-phospho-beta-glucosidase/beta-galactosidase